jgi:hypothetical protein
MVETRILETQKGSRWDRRKGKRERNRSLDERRKRGKERGVCYELKRREEREEEEEKSSCSRKDGPIYTQGEGPRSRLVSAGISLKRGKRDHELRNQVWNHLAIEELHHVLDGRERGRRSCNREWGG